MYNQDLPLNNLQWLICLKTTPIFVLKQPFLVRKSIDFTHTHTHTHTHIHIYIYSTT